SGRMNSLKNFTRSGTGTYGRSRRSISMNPVIFPMRSAFPLVVGAHFDARPGRVAPRVLEGHVGKRPAILQRHHFHESRQERGPVLEDEARPFAAGEKEVALNQAL